MRRKQVWRFYCEHCVKKFDAYLRERGIKV